MRQGLQWFIIFRVGLIWGTLFVCPSIQHPFIRLSIRPSLAGPQTLPAGPKTLLAGPKTLLAGPQTLQAGPQTLLAGPQTPQAEPQTPPAAFRP